MTFGAELRNVAKNFNGIVAVDNVSLEIREGEIIGLLGANGSGKTTLLKILALIEKPSEGEICIDGIRIAEDNIHTMRLQSTMVFQRTTVFDTTVYKNVAYGLKTRKMSKDKIEKEVRRALKLVKLEGFEKRQAKRLSGGEQQRVALARALVLNTKLLLLDEPTANLDPKNVSIIEEIVSTVNHERKTTIVIATHNMFQAKNLLHRIALMKEGRIEEIGTTAEIFGHLSKTLASFAAIENVFSGNAEIAEDGTTLVDIGNDIQLEATFHRIGQISVFISPEDIILSRSRLESSARNILKGKIMEIRDMDPLVRLKIDVGKTFTAQITKRSFNEMALNLNTDVYLTFKASNVQII